VAADRIGRTQSALSLQIKRLEEGLGRRLFVRGGRTTALTAEGEIFLFYAKRLLDLQLEAFSRLRKPEMEGDIRFGAPEDFATHYLPDVLATFAQHHPRVRLSVKCDLTMHLLEGFHRGDFDLVLVKRDPAGVEGGVSVWREPLVWAASQSYRQHGPISLVLAPQPCIYRKRALAALDAAGEPWRVSYTSPSFAGSLAAVKAGLGVTVMPANMLPPKIEIYGHPALPELAYAEIALLRSLTLDAAAKKLADHIIESLDGKTPGRKHALGRGFAHETTV